MNVNQLLKKLREEQQIQKPKQNTEDKQAAYAQLPENSNLGNNMDMQILRELSLSNSGLGSLLGNDAQQTASAGLTGIPQMGLAGVVQREEEQEETEENDNDMFTPLTPVQEDEAETDMDDNVIVGNVKLEEPEIEEYTFDAHNFDHAKSLVDDPDKWIEYEIEPELELAQDSDDVTKANFTVSSTIHLPVPKWVNKDSADESQQQWNEFIGPFEEYFFHEKIEEEMKLPPIYLIGKNWDGTPSDSDDPPHADSQILQNENAGLKPQILQTEWLAMLSDYHKEEETFSAKIIRNLLSVQQTVINIQEKDAMTYFGDLVEKVIQKDEDELYHKKFKDLLDGKGEVKIKIPQKKLASSMHIK